MGKAAVAAAASVVAGIGAFAGLTSWLPVAWAEGAALVLTGGALLGASFLMEPKKSPELPGATLPAAQRAQEA